MPPQLTPTPVARPARAGRKRKAEALEKPTSESTSEPLTEEVPREICLPLPAAFREVAADGCLRCGAPATGKFCHWTCARLLANGVGHLNCRGYPQSGQAPMAKEACGWQQPKSVVLQFPLSQDVEQLHNAQIPVVLHGSDAVACVWRLLSLPANRVGPHVLLCPKSRVETWKALARENGLHTFVDLGSGEYGEASLVCVPHGAHVDVKELAATRWGYCIVDDAHAGLSRRPEVAILAASAARRCVVARELRGLAFLGLDVRGLPEPPLGAEEKGVFQPGPAVAGGIAEDAPAGTEEAEWPAWLGGKLAAAVRVTSRVDNPEPVVIVSRRVDEVASGLLACGHRILVAGHGWEMALSLFPAEAPILVTDASIPGYLNVPLELTSDRGLRTLLLTPEPLVDTAETAPVKKTWGRERTAVARDNYTRALSEIGMPRTKWEVDQEGMSRQEAWESALRSWATRKARGLVREDPPLQVPEAFCRGLTVEQTLANELKEAAEEDAGVRSETLCLFCRRPVVLARERRRSIATALSEKGEATARAGALAGIFECAKCPRVLHTLCRVAWEAELVCDSGYPTPRAELCPQHHCQMCGGGEAVLACVSCPFASCWSCIREETAAPWKELTWVGFADGPRKERGRIRCPACVGLGIRAS